MKLPAEYEAAKHTIMKAANIDESHYFKSEAERMRFRAFQAKDPDLHKRATKLIEYSIRRLGQLMKKQGETIGFSKGGRPVKTGGRRTPVKPITLGEAGIDKELAKRARKAEQMPDDRFEIHAEAIANRSFAVIGVTQQTKRIQSWSGKVEWHTPKEYVELAREVMGDIDLDPASSALAQRTIKAAEYFDEDDDGLSRQWSGRVFLNPPYAMPFVKQFSEKMVKSYKDGEIKVGIILTNNATDTEWARLLCENADAVCFTVGRIRFLEAMDGERIEEKAAPTNGQMFSYFGSNVTKFKKIFSNIGYIFDGPAFSCGKQKVNGNAG